MKSLKLPFGNLRSLALLIPLAVLLLFISGFIATKTLLFPGKSKESSAGPNVNASFIERSEEGNSNKPGVTQSKPVVTTDHPGVISGNPNVMVWVNTSSAVYHCPNTRWYGNTINGKYMTQQEAQSKGYRPAHGSVCG